MRAISYAEDMSLNYGYSKQQQNHIRVWPWVLRFMVFGLLAALVAALVLVDIEIGNSSGPQQAFETHLLALDEQKWELADTFVVERCQTDSPRAREAAGQDLKSMGLSFSSAFVVDEVWLNEDGRTALLDLKTPPNLAALGAATMERVDGDWLVSCS